MAQISFKIDAQIEIKLKKISDLALEKRIELEALRADYLEAMHRYARISVVGASTRIENAVLTDVEVDWVDATLGDDSRIGSFEKHKPYIENKLSKDKERSIEEVAGLRRVLTLIYEQSKNFFPLKETDLRGLHQELLSYYPAASHYLGQYKIASNSVVEFINNQTKKEIFKTADPGLATQIAMSQLVDWYNQNLTQTIWPLVVICEFVFRFLAIHPFQDGNGRLGRSLFLMGLLQCGDKNFNGVAPYLAIDRQIEKSKEEYYIVLRQCSNGIFKQDPKEYRIEFFLNFMLKMVERSLEFDIDYYKNKYSNFLNLSQKTKEVLSCFKDHPEQRLKSSQISKITHISRRTVTRALKDLETFHFIRQEGKGAHTQYQLIF